MNISMGAAANLKESGKFLSYGIKDVTFKGIEKRTVGKEGGQQWTTLAVLYDVDGYGEYIQNLFEPQSTERTEGLNGRENPSPVEHFIVSLRQIFDAVAPQVSRDMDAGTVQIGGKFEDIIKQATKLTANSIGTKTQLKFLPGRNGFAQIPAFPARIDTSGNLMHGTRFIGADLTISAYEKTSIDKANATRQAGPTNMRANESKNDTMSGMANDIDDDDLPF